MRWLRRRTALNEQLQSPTRPEKAQVLNDGAFESGVMEDSREDTSAWRSGRCEAVDVVGDCEDDGNDGVELVVTESSSLRGHAVNGYETNTNSSRNTKEEKELDLRHVPAAMRFRESVGLMMMRETRPDNDAAVS